MIVNVVVVLISGVVEFKSLSIRFLFFHMCIRVIIFQANEFSHDVWLAHGNFQFVCILFFFCFWANFYDRHLLMMFLLGRYVILK